MAEAYPRALTWAYLQWQLANQLLGRMMERGIEADQLRPSQLRTQAPKVFGRWLQTMQQYSREQLHDRFPLFPRQPFDDERSRDELVRMLKNSVRMSPDQATGLADELLEMVSEFINRAEELNAVEDDVNVLFTEDHQHPENGGHLVVAEFRTKSCPRVSYLAHKYGKLSTALVCLRYAPLKYYRRGESGISVTSLNILRDIGGATHEGFASPLNCRLLGRPDTKFCSLFADTDSAFGSLGNFFSINLSDHPGGWILNPPFVEPVMEATARKVLEVLRKAEPGSIWFYITFPVWEDNIGWEMLDGSEKMVARIDFANGSLQQQDSYGTVTRPREPLCIFVLGKPPTNVDLIELRDRLSRRVEVARVNADWLEACRRLDAT